jgi:hypothetical protein
MASSLKLSPHLKALINAPHSLPSPIASPGRAALNQLFDKISSKGEKYGIGHETWLTLSTAALVTVNSPESVGGLWEYAKNKGVDGVEAASVCDILTLRRGRELIIDYEGDRVEMYFFLRCKSIYPET